MPKRKKTSFSRSTAPLSKKTPKSGSSSSEAAKKTEPEKNAKKEMLVFLTGGQDATHYIVAKTSLHSRTGSVALKMLEKARERDEKRNAENGTRPGSNPLSEVRFANAFVERLKKADNGGCDTECEEWGKEMKLELPDADVDGEWTIDSSLCRIQTPGDELWEVHSMYDMM